MSYLKEALQPPDLEDPLSEKHADLEETPPLDTSVGALGSVSVSSLADNDVALLVLDLSHELGHLSYYSHISLGPMELRSRMFDIPSLSNGSCGASLSGT